MTTPAKRRLLERGAVLVKAISLLAIGSSAVGIGGLFLTNVTAIAIVLILAACWVLADAGRTERLALIIRAVRDTPLVAISEEGAPSQASPTAPPRAVGGHRWVLANVLWRGDRQA